MAEFTKFKDDRSRRVSGVSWTRATEEAACGAMNVKVLLISLGSLRHFLGFEA